MDTFRSELEGLINRHSMENGSNTPSFILADYLHRQLEVFDATIGARDKWYGIEPRPGWRADLTAPRASGLDEFVSAHATRDGEVMRAAVADGVLPAQTTVRCAGSGRVVGPRESASEVRCPTCIQVVETVDNGFGPRVVEHTQVVG